MGDHTTVVSTGTARRKREQRRRATARHVDWHRSLCQASSAHHTASGSGLHDSIAALTARLVTVEKKLADGDSLSMNEVANSDLEEGTVPVPGPDDMVLVVVSAELKKLSWMLDNIRSSIDEDTLPWSAIVSNANIAMQKVQHSLRSLVAAHPLSCHAEHDTVVHECAEDVEEVSIESLLPRTARAQQGAWFECGDDDAMLVDRDAVAALSSGELQWAVLKPSGGGPLVEQGDNPNGTFGETPQGGTRLSAETLSAESRRVESRNLAFFLRPHTVMWEESECADNVLKNRGFV